MKASNTIFILLISLIIIVSIVVIFSMIYPNDFNLELMGRFFDIMERVITLIGGGYLGVQVGENYPLRRNKK